MEPVWLTEARRHIGLREIKGAQHESRIVAFWKAIRMGGIRDDETPWCAAFVGGCLEAVGIVSARSGTARDYLNWGVPIEYPLVGCVAVFSRLGGGGHVGFVEGRDEHYRLQILSGNQGDEVSVAPFELSRLLGYRWPLIVPVPVGHMLPVIPSGGRPASAREA
jgi:uncharacterized protein (TIGR02594 family)